MTDVYCSRTDCLNNRNEKCEAKEIQLHKLCQDFASARDCMEADVSPMERKNGALVNKQRPG